MTGEMNLKHAAELIIARLEQYEEAMKRLIEAALKKAEPANEPTNPTEKKT